MKYLWNNIPALITYISSENTPLLYKWYNITKDDVYLKSFSISDKTQNIHNRGRFTFNSSFYISSFFPYPPTSFNVGNEMRFGIGNTDIGEYGEIKCKNCDMIYCKARTMSSSAGRAVFINTDDLEIVMYGYTNEKTFEIVFKDADSTFTANATTTVDNYITNKSALGMAYSGDWVAQPLVIANKVTPLFTITSNSDSSSPTMFTDISIGGKIFKMVGYNLAVEIEME